MLSILVSHHNMLYWQHVLYNILCTIILSSLLGFLEMANNNTHTYTTTNYTLTQKRNKCRCYQHGNCSATWQLKMKFVSTLMCPQCLLGLKISTMSTQSTHSYPFTTLLLKNHWKFGKLKGMIFYEQCMLFFSKHHLLLNKSAFRLAVVRRQNNEVHKYLNVIKQYPLWLKAIKRNTQTTPSHRLSEQLITHSWKGW